jgi:hypothetical protein
MRFEGEHWPLDPSFVEGIFTKDFEKTLESKQSSIKEFEQENTRACPSATGSFINIKSEDKLLSVRFKLWFSSSGAITEEPCLQSIETIVKSLYMIRTKTFKNELNTEAPDYMER